MGFDLCPPRCQTSRMSYDAVLTEAEFAKFTPNAEVVRYLELTRQRLGLQKSGMNVLDWGSGRGEYVTWLRAAGLIDLRVEHGAQRVGHLLADPDYHIRVGFPRRARELHGL